MLHLYYENSEWILGPCTYFLLQNISSDSHSNVCERKSDSHAPSPPSLSLLLASRYWNSLRKRNGNVFTAFPFQSPGYLRQQACNGSDTFYRNQQATFPALGFVFITMQLTTNPVLRDGEDESKLMLENCYSAAIAKPGH